MRRTLSGENKQSTISPDIINEALMYNANEKFFDEKELYIVHDPSDIRKPYSKDLEDLGKVRDLKGNVINGYSTHNVIALRDSKTDVTLISNKTYSNKSRSFLKQSTIKDIVSNVDFDGKEELQKVYNTGDYFNKKIITKSELRRCSEGLKLNNKSLLLTHILDREFDDNEYMDYISELKDYYVIRSKKSRTTNKTISGKKELLIKSKFDNTKDIPFQKLSIKNTTVQDGCIKVEWTKYSDHTAVKVSILDRNNLNVFDDSMLLLTNREIDSDEDAYSIYKIYLKRSKIEYVFKFLKDGLGWEDMQLQDFKAIENIISLAFYAASYLYEIGEESAYDDYAVALAELGDGKGKVTRHFILEGILITMNYCKFELYRKKKNLSDEYVERLKSAFTIEL